MTVTFHGWNTHPGLAKGKMVNSIKVAADFLARLPRDGLSPETTAGKEGFVHPYVMDSSVEKTSIKLLIRDFDAAKLGASEALLAQLAQAAAADWPGARAETHVTESYRNMKEVLDHYPQVMENARQAIRRAGLTLHESAIRGGTDGSRLSFMGLPTPNLFVGEHNYHSRLEWISAQDMQKSAEVIVELARIWEEQA
jgi:tripeptide aminopeptidase